MGVLIVEDSGVSNIGIQSIMGDSAAWSVGVEINWIVLVLYLLTFVINRLSQTYLEN